MHANMKAHRGFNNIEITVKREGCFSLIASGFVHITWPTTHDSELSKPSKLSSSENSINYYTFFYIIIIRIFLSTSKIHILYQPEDIQTILSVAIGVLFCDHNQVLILPFCLQNSPSASIHGSAMECTPAACKQW